MLSDAMQPGHRPSSAEAEFRSGKMVYHVDGNMSTVAPSDLGCTGGGNMAHWNGPDTLTAEAR